MFFSFIVLKRKNKGEKTEIKDDIIKEIKIIREVFENIFKCRENGFV